MIVKLVIVNIEDCPRLLRRPERFCSLSRLIRCRSANNESIRVQGYAAELALSYALSGEKLLPPVYTYADNGKPVTDSGFVSLSHSGNTAVCAYGEKLVGVDIEKRRQVSPRLARRILSERDIELYNSSPGSDFLLERFVLKEAYFKMTGVGVGGAFKEIDLYNGIIYKKGEPVGFAYSFDLDGGIGYLVSECECDIETTVLTDRLIPDPAKNE